VTDIETTGEGGGAAPDDLVLVQPAGVHRVWKLLLNRPPVNAMSVSLYRAMLNAFDFLESRDDVACVLVGSAIEGRFCGGADTKELAALTHQEFSMADWERREALTEAFVRRIQGFAYPTVAVLDGYAIGAGFVLASLCDLRFASDRTWFSIPELDVSRLGGGAHALRVLPQAIVRAMYFQGERLTAETAASLGFVNRVVDQGELWEVAIDAATQIARREPHALRVAKHALNLSEGEPVIKGFELERLYSFRLAANERAKGIGE
jgi:enoyl-CoA hydratase